MRTPDISIVVPVYKVKENLLRKCIQSCMNQNNSNIEIILVDDCSPDLCGSICEEYAQIDPRIKVIHLKQNSGISAARNAGVKNAIGEWITFLDGDDWLEKETCNLIYDIPDKDIEMVFFGMCRDYSNMSEVIDFCYEDRKIFKGDECKELQLDVLNYYRRFSTAYCKIIRRDLIEKNNIFHNEEVKYGIEGIEYCIRLLGYVQSAISINKHYYHYVYNLESITGTPNENTNKYVLLGLKKIRDYIEKSEDPSLLLKQYRKRVKRIVIDTSLGCYFNPNYKAHYKERISQFKKFTSDEEINDTLSHRIDFDSNIANEMAYLFAKQKCYPGLFLMGKIRELILRHK